MLKADESADEQGRPNQLRCIGPQSLWIRPQNCLAAAALLVAACAPPSERYYPLDAGRSWTYAMTIQPASGQAATATSLVTNLSERTVAGRTVTPQQAEAFDQRRLRFISVDDRGVVEIADQDSNASEPQIKSPPNSILKTPIAVGATWETTWETNQFGKRTLLPMTKKIESTEGPCTVPAGTFSNCLHLRLTGSGPVSADDGSAIVDVDGEEWFAPSVGYVRGIFMESVRGLPQNGLRIEVALTASAP
jgi:hypothetical protein